MSASRSTPSLALAIVLASLAPGHAEPAAPASMKAGGRLPADLAGSWTLVVGGESCRVMLRPQKAYNGEYFIGVPPPCRHSIPEFAKVGHWAMPDPTHIKLTENAGATVLVLAAVGDAFTASVGDRVYTLRQIAGTGRSAAGFAPVEPMAAPGFTDIVPVSKRSKTAAIAQETPSEIGGRYAVMREKRDTGCMVTLDEKSRVKGGSRAQLAPGCRDQGIVIFDPTAWTIVKGELVLTARAGHKARLVKAGEGSWQKDTKDGSKPLGLKKL